MNIKRWLQGVDRGLVKWVGPAGFILGLLLAVAIGLPTGIDIYQNWQNIDPGERSQAGITLLQTLFTIVGGVAIFWNIVLSRRQLAATEDRNISDRFSQAVEQLGHGSSSVRVGGIYALGRIAQDSPRDYWPVMEVLVSFIRDNKPLSPDKVQPPVRYDQRDVQAAIIMIGRRNPDWISGDRLLSLNHADLREIPFYDGDYRCISFHCSDLSQAKFHGANVSYSRFWQARMHRANLTQANFSHTDLEEADLQGAVLTDCILKDANLQKANLEGAIGLTAQQVKSAKNWRNATYDPDLQAQLEPGLNP